MAKLATSLEVFVGCVVSPIFHVGHCLLNLLLDLDLIVVIGAASKARLACLLKVTAFAMCIFKLLVLIMKLGIVYTY